LLEGKFLFIREHFLNQLKNFILSLHSVQKDLTATALFGESALFRQSARDRVGDGDVGEDQLDIFRNNEAILIKIVSTQTNENNFVRSCQDLTYMSKISLSLVSRFE